MKFFIGLDDGTGEETNSRDDFFRRLEDYIQTAEENQKKYFSITIEKEE